MGEDIILSAIEGLKMEYPRFGQFTNTGWVASFATSHSRFSMVEKHRVAVQSLNETNERSASCSFS